MADLTNINTDAIWEESFASQKPEVKLLSKSLPVIPQREKEDDSGFWYVDFDHEMHIAAAKTCYAPNIALPENVTEKQIENIGPLTYDARHHSVFQHSQFTFTLDRISRQFVWSHLHSHPFYNSEQRSQRYNLKGHGNSTVPKFKTQEQQRIYEESISYSHEQYQILCNELFEVAAENYFSIFPGRNPDKLKDEKEKNNVITQVKRRAAEIARYVLPVSTHTGMYHSINAIVLARLYRLHSLPDSSVEARYVITKMVEEVAKTEPKFIELIDDPIVKENLLESRMMKDRPKGLEALVFADEFVNEFDKDMTSSTKLSSYDKNGESLLANAIRAELGLANIHMSDEEAISSLLNPRKNPQISDTLFLLHTSKLSRALAQINYSWKMILSHTADSQEQRHRMTPGSRPIMELTIPSYPDYVKPSLIRSASDKIQKLYASAIEKTWEDRNRLLDLGASLEQANMVLTNAVKLRFYESTNLLNFHPKSTIRSCLNAQEEIWRATVQQNMDVQEVHPLIGVHLGAPCELRYLSNTKPVCPEKDHYCGVPVWLSRNGKEQYSLAHLIKKRTI